MSILIEHLQANPAGARAQRSTLMAIILILLAGTSLRVPLANASTSAGAFDGPAALPRVSLQTAMANTPAPGITISVKAGESFQAALNSARCGDTIHLQAGATFTGLFTFPNKGCDDSHWIIVRTSSDNSLLPQEGSRLTPCYAGVSSLPGRPALNCASTRNVLAKLVVNRGGTSGPIIFAPGANHYRLIGLELTRTAGIGLVYALATPASGAVTNKIIYDRLWLHGTAHDETTRGIELGGGTNVSVINSFFTDFHCVSGGHCSDSQTIHGGVGNHPMGPYKIVNNFLEASGENIMFGGGWATYTPADIEIRRNHIFKPLTWMKGQPGYVGGANGNPFIVKNLFELKNAQRVLLDGNIMEYVWGGFSQVGFAILLTPKNPGSSSPCSICNVTDVTIRYSYIAHMASGMQLANAASDSGALPKDGGRYSIHDVVFDDINGTKYRGNDQFMQVSTSTHAPVLHDVRIAHTTAFPKRSSFMVGDVLPANPRMPNFVFTNSIINAGSYPVWSTGTGGDLNCAAQNSPLVTFNACFSPYGLSSNAVVAAPGSWPPSTWPTHNYFPTTLSEVEFVNYNGGDGGNYQLQSSSPYKNAATDGKDLGADMPSIRSAISGVK